MKTITIGNEQYRLPDLLQPFQQEIYIHLIQWKWAHLTRECGYFAGQPYDAILPGSRGRLPPAVSAHC